MASVGVCCVAGVFFCGNCNWCLIVLGDGLKADKSQIFTGARECLRSICGEPNIFDCHNKRPNFRSLTQNTAGAEIAPRCRPRSRESLQLKGQFAQNLTRFYYSPTLIPHPRNPTGGSQRERIPPSANSTQRKKLLEPASQKSQELRRLLSRRLQFGLKTWD